MTLVFVSYIVIRIDFNTLEKNFKSLLRVLLIINYPDVNYINNISCFTPENVPERKL